LEANRLMQETLNVLLAERQQAPNNPPRPTKSAFEKFDASRPPIYDGTVDPKVMLEWVDQVESLFTVHETPEQKKVEIATFYLRKEASKWWRQVRTACSWEEFKKMLDDRFYPEALKELKVQEFLELKQGFLSVQDYTDKFNELAPYAKMIVPTELALTRRYEKGFNDALAALVVGMPLNTFNGAYNRALQI